MKWLYIFLAKLDQRLTAYEKNTNIKQFIFSTPFTKSSGGASRGSIENQYNKKTILTTDHFFPYLKTRIKIKEKTEIILTPIEVAIEDVMIKLSKLQSAMTDNRLTLLQMELQSCVATVVQAGPMEIANTFLRYSTIGAWHCFIIRVRLVSYTSCIDIGQALICKFWYLIILHRAENQSKYPTEHIDTLKSCFKDLCTKCEEALKYNRKHLKNGQEQYHKHLQTRYHDYDRPTTT